MAVLIMVLLLLVSRVMKHLDMGYVDSRGVYGG